MPKLPNIPPELLKTYQEEIVKRSSPATAKRKSSSLKRFFDWAHKEGHIDESPIERVQPVISPQEIQPVKQKKPQISRFKPATIFRFGILLGLVVLVFLLLQKLKLPIPFKFAPATEKEIAQQTPQPSPLPQAIDTDAIIAELREEALKQVKDFSINWASFEDGNLLIGGADVSEIALSTADTSDGDITVNPDGSGIAHFLFEGTGSNFLNAQAPNLIDGSLYYGIVANNATGYDLIKLQSGSNPVTRFLVDALGETYIGGGLDVNGDLATEGTTHLTAEGELENITGYSQTEGNFSINQTAGASATITKKTSALSDLMVLTLDERGKPANPNSIYSTLVLNRYDGSREAMALFVDEGNARFDGQAQLGRFSSNPTSIGQGSLVFNTSDTSVYFWDGSSWNQLAAGGTSPWTRASGVIYPTTTTDDLAIGGTDSTAPFFVDDSGNVTIDGNTTIGDASGDTVTANAASWTFANDTNFALSGGINGLSFDTDTLSIDATNGRVGIGTTSPDTNLHVFNASAGSLSAAANTVLTLENNTDAFINFLTPNSRVSGLRTDTPTGNGYARMVYDDSALEWQLDLNSGNHWQISRNTIENQGYNANFTLSNTSGNITVSASTDNDVLIGDGTTILFVDGSTGNVGIGTSSPDELLEVEGAVVGKALVSFNEQGDQNILTASASGTTVFNLTRAGNIEADGVFSFGDSTPDGNAYNTIGTGDATSGNITDASDLYITDSLEVGGNICFGTDCQTSWDAGGRWTLNTTPTPDILHPDDTTWDITLGGTDSTAPFFMDVSTGNLTLTGDIDVEGGDINSDADNTISLYSGATSGENPYLYIYGYDTAAGTTRYGRIRVDSAGTFTIEPQNVGESLDLNSQSTGDTFINFDGNANIRLFSGADSTETPQLRTFGYITAFAGTKYGYISVEDTNDTFQIGTQDSNIAGITFAPSGTEQVRITDGGNVGIGDPSPAALLTVGSGDLFQVNSSGQLTFVPGTTGTFVDFQLETEWTTGTLINADFGGATTLTGTDVTAASLNLNTNVTGTADVDVTGINVQTPTLTQSTAVTTNYTVYNNLVSGALTQDTLAGTINWRGTNITMPNITQTTGAITADGLRVANGTITTDGTQNLVNLVASGVGNGTLTGINIGGITASGGAETALIIGSGWDTGLDANSNSLLNLGDAGTDITSTVFSSGVRFNLSTTSGEGIDGGGLADCDAATTSKLLWDDTTNQFSCGTDQDTGGGTTTLQIAYGNDADGGDATISLTTADDSLVFTNPTSSGTDSSFLLHLNQQNTTAAVTVLDITQSSNAADAVNILADSIDGEIALDISADALTTGTGISMASTSNGYTTGSLITASLTQSAATGTSVSGDIGSVSFSPTYSTAITTPTISGNVFDINRNTITNSLFASTLTVSGDVVSISDAGTQTTGTLTNTANILELSQQYSGATGAVLNILNSGSGADISLDNSETISNATDTEIALSDGTNTLTMDFDEDTATAIDFTTNGSVDLTFNPGGSVGIGTTSPTTDLQIGTADSGSRTISISGAATASDEGGEIQLDMAADYDTTYDFWRIDTYQDDLRFGPTGATNVTLQPGGSVGIGSTAPSTKLEIKGTGPILTTINQTGTDDWAGYRIDRDGVEKWFLGMPDTNDYFYFRRAGSTNDMIIDTNGRVGIGDATPDALLDFDFASTSTTGGTEYGGFFTFTDTGVVTTGTDTGYGLNMDVNRSGATGGTINTYGLNIDLDSDAAGAGTATNYGLFVNVAGGDNNYAAIFEAGSVGIGLTAPEEDLTVANNIQLGITDGTRYIYFDNGTANNAGIRYESTGNTMQFSHDGTTWTDIGSGGGSSVWSDLTDPTADLSLTHADWTTAFSWNTASDVGDTFFALDVTNDLVTDTTTQTLFSLVNADDAIGTGTLERLLYINNADANEAVTDGILIDSTGAGGITDAIDASATNITNAINVGTNKILGTTGDIDFSNFDVTGSTGNITTAGDIAVNGGNVTSTGNLTLNATSTVIILDADTFQTNDITNTGTITIESGGIVQLGIDDDFLPQLGAGSADIGASGTLWDNIFAVAGDFSGTVTGFDFSCTDCLDFTEFEDTLDLDNTLTLNQTTNTWTQNFTGTTTTGFTYNANSLTSGTALALASTATAFTGNLMDITLSGSNAANTGSLLSLTNSGTLNTNTSFYIKHYATGTNNLAMRVDDVASDTSPFVIDGDGNVGIGNPAPALSLEVGNITLGVDATDGVGVAGDLEVEDFALLGAIRVGSTGTDPGPGELYTEGDIYVAGNDINRTASANLNLFAATAGNPELRITGYDVGAVGTRTTSLYIDDSGNFWVQRTTSDVELHLSFGTGVRVNSTGVGIGDITPDALLDFDFSSTSATAGTEYGGFFTFTDTGVVTTGSDIGYGLNLDVNRSGATGGTINTYGLNIDLDSDAAGAGTATNYGLFVNVAGGDNNYAAIFEAGSVGIGTTGPDSPLDVLSTGGTQLRLTYTDGSVFTTFDTDASGYLDIDPSGSRTSIDGSLQVGSVATAPVAYSRFGTTSTSHSFSTPDQVLTGALEVDGILYLDGSSTANDAGVIHNSNGTLFAKICSQGGSGPCASTSALENLLTQGSWNIDNNANVGKAALMVNQQKGGDIFTASASGTAKFTIDGSGNATFYQASTIDTNGNNQLTIDIGTSKVCVSTDGSNCSGKIDVGTVDPIYTIGGTSYATYMAGMIGVKEEVTGTVEAKEYVPGVGYAQTIDFKDLEAGSDLWLFTKATDLAKQIDKMVILLSPSGNARTWYDVDEANYTLTVYSTRPTSISYRLTAPRFDTEAWGNYADLGSTGFILDDEPLVVNEAGDIEAGDIDYLAGIEIVQDETQDYKVKLITGEIMATVDALAKLVVGNIKAGAVEAQEIATDSFSAFQGTVDNLLITSGLVSPIIETETISPLADSDIIIDLENSPPEATESSFGKLIVKGEAGQEVASIDAAGNASFSGSLAADKVETKEIVASKIYADEIVAKDGRFGQVATESISGITLEEIEELLRQAEQDQTLMAAAQTWDVANATDSANLAELAVSNLYVTDQAAINILSVSSAIAVGPDLVIQSSMVDDLATNSIDTLTAPLSLQSLALAPIEMMAGMVRIDTNGDVTIEGNLYVAGTIESSGLTLKESEENGFGKLLSLEDTAGLEVAAISASGAAEFAQVTTDKLVIAGADSFLPPVIASGEITTNATAGQAIIPAGASQITINNPNVTDYTLVYITPTSSTLNKVLYVKSKTAGQFVVGFSDPLSIDVEFNWWVINVRQ